MNDPSNDLGSKVPSGAVSFFSNALQGQTSGIMPLPLSTCHVSHCGQRPPDWLSCSPSILTQILFTISSFLHALLLPLYPAELRPQQPLSTVHTFHFLVLFLLSCSFGKTTMLLKFILYCTCTWVTYPHTRVTYGPRTTQRC